MLCRGPRADNTRCVVSAVGSSLQYKLCRVKHQQLGAKGVPYIVTHDGRTIRYPNPDIKVNDTIQLEIETGKVLDFVHFEAGQVAMVTGGRNIGTCS